MERRGAKFGVVTYDELDTYLPRFFELHLQRWHDPLQSQHYLNPRIREFDVMITRRLAERGWLRLFYLALGADIVAMLYGMAYEGWLYYYKSAFSEEHAELSPGTVLLGQCLLHSIEEGLEAFDFLRGTSAYKYMWSDHTVETATYVFDTSSLALCIVNSLGRPRRAVGSIMRFAFPTGLRRWVLNHLPMQLRAWITKLLYERL
jgi:CelD/BcsL family acetyltransferase involved in cellulose biosynthesis